MNNNLTERLFTDCPLIYRPNSDEEQTIINSREFECGDGWFEIIHELSLMIESIAYELQRNGTPLSGLPHVQQVKEKFGDLRFYIDNGRDDIEELIYQARLKASVTCELCGAPGHKQETNKEFMMVVCENCAKNDRA